MARYEHLPIYKKAMDLTIYLEKIVRNFSRYHKYTLGSELRAKSREIVGVVIAANSRVDKLALLLELREKLEGLQVLLRICKEVRAFNAFSSYAYAGGLEGEQQPERRAGGLGLVASCEAWPLAKHAADAPLAFGALGRRGFESLSVPSRG